MAFSSTVPEYHPHDDDTGIIIICLDEAIAKVAVSDSIGMVNWIVCLEGEHVADAVTVPAESLRTAASPPPLTPPLFGSNTSPCLTNVPELTSSSAASSPEGAAATADAVGRNRLPDVLFMTPVDDNALHADAVADTLDSSMTFNLVESHMPSPASSTLSALTAIYCRPNAVSTAAMHRHITPFNQQLSPPLLSMHADSPYEDDSWWWESVFFSPGDDLDNDVLDLNDSEPAYCLCSEAMPVREQNVIPGSLEMDASVETEALNGTGSRNPGSEELWAQIITAMDKVRSQIRGHGIKVAASALLDITNSFYEHAETLGLTSMEVVSTEKQHGFELFCQLMRSLLDEQNKRAHRLPPFKGRNGVENIVSMSKQSETACGKAASITSPTSVAGRSSSRDLDRLPRENWWSFVYESDEDWERFRSDNLAGLPMGGVLEQCQADEPVDFEHQATTESADSRVSASTQEETDAPPPPPPPTPIGQILDTIPRHIIQSIEKALGILLSKLRRHGTATEKEAICLGPTGPDYLVPLSSFQALLKTVEQCNVEVEGLAYYETKNYE